MINKIFDKEDISELKALLIFLYIASFVPWGVLMVPFGMFSGKPLGDYNIGYRIFVMMVLYYPASVMIAITLFKKNRILRFLPIIYIIIALISLKLGFIIGE